MIFLKLVLHVNHWNWIVHACVWGSYLIYLLLSAFISTIYLKAPFFSAQYFILCTPAALPPSPLASSSTNLWLWWVQRTDQLLMLPTTYAWIALGIVACLLPDLLAVLYATRFFLSVGGIEHCGRNSSVVHAASSAHTSPKSGRCCRKCTSA